MKKALLSILIFLVPATVYSEQYSWIAGNPNMDKWFITKGEARVVISNDSIYAELYDYRLTDFKRFTIKGTLNGGTVSAVVTTEASDIEPERIRGTYKVAFDGQTTSKAIILVNDWSFWALTTSE